MVQIEVSKEHGVPKTLVRIARNRKIDAEERHDNRGCPDCSMTKSGVYLTLMTILALTTLNRWREPAASS